MYFFFLFYFVLIKPIYAFLVSLLFIICVNAGLLINIRNTCIMFKWFKPKSDIHCNRSATSPRLKFKTIAEVAEESQLGFAVGRRLVGDWSATNRGLVAD